MSYSNSTPSLFTAVTSQLLPIAGESSFPLTSYGYYSTTNDHQKPCLPVRMFERISLISNNCLNYLQRKFNEHTVTSLASISILIILLPIICCFLASLMRQEERRIKEQYKKLSRTSSQSFIGIGDGRKVNSLVNTFHHKSITIGQPNSLANNTTTSAVLGSTSANSVTNRNDPQKFQVFELRRETYFGLVRLLKPGCRTIVLLCDAHSRPKLLSRFYQYIYPYRKNKSLQFAFLLIEKNINWYRDLLKSTLIVERDLQINPINCIGTVLVFNGFKKHFSIYHASESKYDPEEPLFLLEESLLDNFPGWLERFFAGRVAKNYVKYWPEQMR